MHPYPLPWLGSWLWLQGMTAVVHVVACPRTAVEAAGVIEVAVRTPNLGMEGAALSPPPCTLTSQPSLSLWLSPCACVCVFACLCRVSLCRSVSRCVVSLCRSVSRCVALCLAVPLCVLLCRSVSRYVALCLCVSCACLWPCMCMWPCLCLCPWVCGSPAETHECPVYMRAVPRGRAGSALADAPPPAAPTTLLGRQAHPPTAPPPSRATLERRRRRDAARTASRQAFRPRTAQSMPWSRTGTRLGASSAGRTRSAGPGSRGTSRPRGVSEGVDPATVPREVYRRHSHNHGHGHGHAAGQRQPRPPSKGTAARLQSEGRIGGDAQGASSGGVGNRRRAFSSAAEDGSRAVAATSGSRGRPTRSRPHSASPAR